MSNFKKNDQHKFWHSPLALFLLLGVLVIFVYNVVGLIKKERETNEKKSLVLDEIDSLKKREEALSTDIKKLETEQGIEDLIREKYQVVREGEKIVVIVDEDLKNDLKSINNPRHGFAEWFKGIFK